MDDFEKDNIYVKAEPIVEEKKAKSGGFKKVMATVACALLFGLVASGTFVGSTKLINHFFPDTTKTIATVTPSTSDTTTNAGKIPATTVVSAGKLDGTDVSSIAENSMSFTVAVNCTFTTSSWFGKYTTSGSGTGIIVGQNETELLIVTNNHVVDSAKSISVNFVDNTDVTAVTKGTDANADLAVIAVKLADIPEETLSAISFATLGDSDEVKVGEMVVAIGNALGYGQSVTVGYISAKNRNVTVDGVTMNLLQTDAAINPGNSGGALINMKGEVIGINSVKYADDDVEGMGFAIPVSNVKSIIENLMNQLSADEKGYLGIYVNDVTEEIAKYYNWPVGVYVVSFTDNSGAKEAGINVGDIITAVNGISVTNSTDMISSITSNKYGTEVTVTVQRNVNGSFEEMTFKVTLKQSAEYSK